MRARPVDISPPHATTLSSPGIDRPSSAITSLRIHSRRAVRINSNFVPRSTVDAFAHLHIKNGSLSVHIRRRMAHRYSYLEMYERNWTFESTSICCTNYVRIKCNYVSLSNFWRNNPIGYWDTVA